MTTTGWTFGVTAQITLVIDGPVDAASRVAAEDEIRCVLHRAPRPVESVRVKLTVDELRVHSQQAIAQASFEAKGTRIRAVSAGSTVSQAVERVAARLDRRLCHLTAGPASLRAIIAEFRNGGLPDTRPDFFPRPPDQRKVVRHKSPAPVVIGVERAVSLMELQDYGFFLFTDQSDGIDSIVFQDGAALRYQRVTGGDAGGGRPVGVELVHTPGAELCLEEAALRAGVSDVPILFFRQVGSARAAVLYRRYDGHYGLLARPVIEGAGGRRQGE